MRNEARAPQRAQTREGDSETILAAEVAELRSQVKMYRMIMDSIHNGVMVTDAHGIVTHFNKPYGQFLRLDPAQQIGRHCTEVVETTRMHIVAQTGIPEINKAQWINGQNMVVQRIPIRQDGKVIAVFGQVMFKDVKDVRQLAQRLSVLESKVKIYEEELINLRSTRYTFDSIIGESPELAVLKADALKASTSTFPVLISGESGTGKELFAQAIHHASPRKMHPFVRINCAAIPRDLLESELFGYEKGAFTGARTGGKPGKFELAHRGSIFLDEIGEMPVQMQPKLLRILEEKEFERVGGNRVIRSDFRVIAATNQNLEEMVVHRRFRQDLLYRLNVFPIHIPPLRERRGDILPIARHILDRLADEAAMGGLTIGKEAAVDLQQHDWPGNVRELSNVLERAVSTAGGLTVGTEDLPFYIHRRHADAPQPANRPIRDAVARAEMAAILRALEQSGNNKSRAARLLGIHRTLLYKKMKKYDL